MGESSVVTDDCRLNLSGLQSRHAKGQLNPDTLIFTIELYKHNKKWMLLPALKS